MLSILYAILILWAALKIPVFFAIPFRGYLRSVVYNYVLANDIPLKRLRERNPKRVAGGWELEDIHYLSTFSPDLKGFVKLRRVTKVQYYLALCLWIFLDDDSNHDTTDAGYIKTLTSGERKSWHRIFNPFLKRAKVKAATYGNAFDLGDVRAEHPYFNFFTTLVWNDRNTLMNAKYLWRDY